MGAPITAYNRISSERSTVHSNIYFPDYVVVVDETLLSSVDVTAGLKAEGAIVINSGKSPDQLRPLLKGYAGKVCTIDAGKISEEELGQELPQHPHAGRHREGVRRGGRERIHQGYGGLLPPQVRLQAPGHRGQYARAQALHAGGADWMSNLAKDMTPEVTWKDITVGCCIYEGGTSQTVETGDWRTPEARHRLGQVQAVPAVRPLLPRHVHPRGARRQAGRV
jgi:hypothetical protein